jgi:hypothetical protein
MEGLGMWGMRGTATGLCHLKRTWFARWEEGVLEVSEDG